MELLDISQWSNENSGYLALIIFLVTLLISFIIFLFKKTTAPKPSLKIEVIKHPTMCSSFATGNINENQKLHSTAFLIYLKITNDGKIPIQIGNINIAYKSENNKEKWYWINEETTLLEDYMTPIGDKLKVYPFLKQLNYVSPSTTKTYLQSGEDTNGLVYFEQKESQGLDYPSIDSNFKVETKIVVHDTVGNKWSIEYLIVKVQIEPIREICPSFGLTRSYCEKQYS